VECVEEGGGIQINAVKIAMTHVASSTLTNGDQFEVELTLVEIAERRASSSDLDLQRVTQARIDASDDAEPQQYRILADRDDDPEERKV
jgi:hypothetical protein